MALTEPGPDVAVAELDVSNTRSVHQMIRDVGDDLGQQRVAITNAGIICGLACS
ncbi:hypothetical protein [Aquisalimonas sp.]|uniref:hypothetical protein n=1 Tax=Aquisalimonas sp. TaxID=1872621 RepID=UPI0025BC7B06|nr:hypothetical protein [Aquisalimonas sp.]